MRERNHYEVCFRVPEDWNEYTMAMYRSPQTSEGFRRNVIVNREPFTKRSIGEALRAARVDVTRTFHKVGIDSQREFELHGHEAGELMVHYSAVTDQDGAKVETVMKQRLVLVAHAKTLVTLTISDSQENFDENAEQYDDMVESLTFLPEPTQDNER